MNLSSAVGVAAGLALVAVLGVSLVQKPNSARTVTVSQGDTPPSTSGSTGSGPSAPTIVGPPAVTTLPGGPTSAPAPSEGAGNNTAGGTSADTSSESTQPDSPSTPQPTDSIVGGTTLPASIQSVPVTVDKAAAKVGIVNASGSLGVATSAMNTLKKAGWDPKSESAGWAAMAFSVVYYADGKRDLGLAVAASLGLTTAVVLSSQGSAAWDNFASKHYDVLVLASKDLG